MEEIKYRVTAPQYIRLTLRDRAVCLKNLNDPFLTNDHFTLSASNSDEQLVEKLQESRESGLKLENEFPEVDTDSDYPYFSCGSTQLQQRSSSVYRQMTDMNNVTSISEWLLDSFEVQPGNSLPRVDVYNAYVLSCEHNGAVPVNAAKFGKILRQLFPDVRTRRIGVRGHSKYHYCGIGAKIINERETIDHGCISRAINGTNCETTCTKNGEDTSFLKWMSLSVAQEFAKELLPLLHNLPTVEDLGISGPDVPEIRNFLKNYKAHGVKILECVVDADFYKVKDVMWNFWRSIPLSLLGLISIPEVTEGIVRCDQVLYAAINSIIIPQVLKAMPVGLMQTLNDFVDNLLYWTEDLLPLLPLSLRYRKIKACGNFKNSIRHKLQINHLTTCARHTINSYNGAQSLWKDWQKLDLVCLLTNCHSVLGKDRNKLETSIHTYTTMFGQLLLQCSSIDQYMKFVESIVDENMETIHRKTDDGCYKELTSGFVLSWSYITSQILLQLTVKQIKTLGIFHLLDMVFKDYILFCMEKWTQQSCDTI